ncbi:MAG: radical SAM protein [Bdellovibrionales bacterium RIFOXYD1_FULL_44_7]|nr:MAG: radical SAM protein [Bdellovibrionales bacterium RIFOXYD1_FULL_44_7]
MKLLLTSVFGPFGVDDEYGEKENKMELFHNQVTREQGIFSYRFHHNTYGLNFLAKNLDVPATILDFPTLERFKQELRRGYEYVGISFIMSNFEKARKMAATIRELSPGTKIILGGHGTGIDDLEKMIDHDFICRGEGVKFMRRLFGEDPEKPVRHPIMHSSYNRKLMGVRIPDGSGILIPGVGCPNRCRFCSTSHFFGDYIPYLKTGQEIFDVCCEYEDRLGIRDFGVLDENFMKHPARAMELLELMEKHRRFFTFGIFSSAETLSALPDLDVLVRLGILFIWIGVESKKDSYEKNKGVDFKILVAELRKRGISVMGSVILFTEEHDKESIWTDIDFGISLNADYVQFMQLGPVPGTTLYQEYKKAGRLVDGLPHMKRHGQGEIWFRHHVFTAKESNEYLRMAFCKDYETNGASFVRAMKTNLMGYEYALRHGDGRVRARAAGFREIAMLMRHFLYASGIFSENSATRNLVGGISEDYRRLFGSAGMKERAFNTVVAALAAKESIKMRMMGDVRQPPMRCASV